MAFSESKVPLRGILKDVGNAKDGETGSTNVSSRPPFIDMISEAIGELKERKGSSKQSIVKYILSRYDLVGAGGEQGRLTEKQFSANLNRALKRGVTNEVLKQVSGTGATGRFKLAKKERVVSYLRLSNGNHDSHVLSLASPRRGGLAQLPTSTPYLSVMVVVLLQPA